MEGEENEPKPDSERCPKCGGWIVGFAPGESECQGCGYVPPGMKSVAAEEEKADTPPSTDTIVCPKCSTSFPLDYGGRYCDECGASLAGARPAAPSAPGSVRIDGVCPACGGPVRELAPDVGVCTKCGERLTTPEARTRNFWGLAVGIMLLIAYCAFLAARGL